MTSDMTPAEKELMLGCLSDIRRKIDSLVGRDRQIYLLACQSNIQLWRLTKSMRKLIGTPEFAEYSKYVDDQIDKSA